jgi:Uma2 family endonuclease
MSIEVSTINQTPNFPPQIAEDDDVFYPDTDESIMPEGILHFLLSVDLVSMLRAFFSKREDVKVFGNCMLYYEKGNRQKFISPDLMVCFGLKESPKRVYKLWETKVVPAVVIEFASDTTWLNDVSSKLAIYQKLGVKEYYVYEVDSTHFPLALMAYRLEEGVLTEIEISNKRILSESLGLELVDTGETLRFLNPETSEFLMTLEEMQTENERLKAELVKLRKQNDGK